MMDFDSQEHHAAKNKFEEAVREYIAVANDRTLQDWILCYSSVNMEDVANDETFYGYLARDHQPIHHTRGLLDQAKDDLLEQIA